MFRRNYAVLSVLVGAGVVTMPIARTQSDEHVPKWEVVSIKPCPPNAMPGGRGPAVGLQGPGRIRLPCASVNALIHQSYLLFPNGRLDLSGAKTPVEKGPPWIDSELYTIEAKAETNEGQTAPGQGTMLGPMLRALLEDRFKLKVHRETRQVPVYALIVSKNGPKLQETPAGACITPDLDHPPPLPAPGQPVLPPCGLPRMMSNGFDFHGATLAQLCAALSNRTDRKVIDKTGIKGAFDIHLDWSGGDLPSGPLPPPPPLQPGGPPVAAPEPGEITAAIQSALQKFGLKLEPTQGPAEILVIDHVERPDEN